MTLYTACFNLTKASECSHQASTNWFTSKPPPLSMKIAVCYLGDLPHEVCYRTFDITHFWFLCLYVCSSSVMGHLNTSFNEKLLRQMQAKTSLSGPTQKLPLCWWCWPCFPTIGTLCKGSWASCQAHGDFRLIISMDDTKNFHLPL